MATKITGADQHLLVNISHFSVSSNKTLFASMKQKTVLLLYHLYMKTCVLPKSITFQS